MLDAVVRRPLVPSDNPPILVLLHGLGADERDLIGLAQNFNKRLCVVSLRAPRVHSNGGYAWFTVTWESDGIHANGREALDSREMLLSTLASLPASLGFNPSNVLLGGFSQGAMMSLGVALSAPETLDGVLLFSGRLLPEFASGEVGEAISGLPFLVQHGTLDPVLKVQGAREMEAFLMNLGCPLTYYEYPMAHEISQESIADAAEWVEERLDT